MEEGHLLIMIPQLGDDQLLFCHLGGIDALVSLLMLYTTESSAKCVPVPYKLVSWLPGYALVTTCSLGHFDLFP